MFWLKTPLNCQLPSMTHKAATGQKKKNLSTSVLPRMATRMEGTDQCKSNKTFQGMPNANHKK
jgi:hypothetical protein